MTDHRIALKDGDTISIEPDGGELMFSVKAVFIDTKSDELPHGALDLVIIPFHMDGKARAIKPNLWVNESEGFITIRSVG